MISTDNFMCNDLKFKDFLLYHLKGQVFKCSEDIWILTCQSQISQIYLLVMSYYKTKTLAFYRLYMCIE